MLMLYRLSFKFISLSLLLYCPSAIAEKESVHAQSQEASYHGKHSEHNCMEPKNDKDSLTNFRDKTHSMLCHAVRNIDSWFGQEEKFDGKSFGGKLILGFRHDEDKGFDPKIRVRIKARLPNVSKRLNAFIGRTDDEAYIRDSQISGIDSLRNDLRNEDARWLIGLGYRNPNKTGFETSVGARFSSGLQPYAKLRYRHYKEFGSLSSHFSQTLFWQNDDGLGTTSNLQFSQPLGENYLSTWSLGATYLKDTEIWETGSSLALYKKLSSTTGISLRAYIFGESGDNSIVDVPEYGISLGYRQPFIKPWLILKTQIENRWEHSDNNEPRESYAKLGVQLEMTFGKYKGKK